MGADCLKMRIYFGNWRHCMCLLTLVCILATCVLAFLFRRRNRSVTKRRIAGGKTASASTGVCDINFPTIQRLLSQFNKRATWFKELFWCSVHSFCNLNHFFWHCILIFATFTMSPGPGHPPHHRSHWLLAHARLTFILMRATRNHHSLAHGKKYSGNSWQRKQSLHYEWGFPSMQLLPSKNLYAVKETGGGGVTTVANCKNDILETPRHKTVSLRSFASMHCCWPPFQHVQFCATKFPCYNVIFLHDRIQLK